VELASGGLWTTAGDLARFVIEVLEASAGRSQKVLPPALARLMITRVLQDQSFGLELSGQGESLRFRHGGWNDGFKAELVG
jgi:CubicO group peptidase (beta-lactamase class C family)